MPLLERSADGKVGSEDVLELCSLMLVDSDGALNLK